MMLKKHHDSYHRGMNICAHAGFEPNIIMFFDQLQTAYNVARSGQAGIVFFRDGILKYTENTERLCCYKLGDPLAKRAMYSERKVTATLGCPLRTAMRISWKDAGD